MRKQKKKKIMLVLIRLIIFQPLLRKKSTKPYDLETEKGRNDTCCGNPLSWASKIFGDQKPIYVAVKFFVTNVVMIMSDTLSDIVQFFTYISRKPMDIYWASFTLLWIFLPM